MPPPPLQELIAFVRKFADGIYLNGYYGSNLVEGLESDVRVKLCQTEKPSSKKDCDGITPLDQRAV